MKAFAKKYQISLFLILTVIIGWTPWYFGKGSVIMAAPLLAALIVGLMSEGLMGLKRNTISNDQSKS